MSFAEEVEAAISQVTASAGASLVRIGRDGGRGAGTVIAPGIVLTSAHHIRGPQVTVTFPDGRSVMGDVKGLDAEGDLAAVAVDTASAPAVTWQPDAVHIGLGTVVFALGALRSGGVRVTLGTVAAQGAAFRGPRGRLITDAFEHTAVVGRGNSGGPVVDAEGRLVGVNTHRPGDGLYLALPAGAALKERVDALSRGESPQRRRLGVALTPPHVAARLRSAVGLAPRDGVLVRDVDPEGAAAAAGVQRGDLIVAAGASPIESPDDLMAAVESVGGDLTLSITVVRGSEELALTVAFPA